MTDHETSCVARPGKADQAQTLPGIYVHVPFCAKRCDYCDFTTYAGRDELIDGYVDAVITHLQRSARQHREQRFATVFIGGGTPTYLPPKHLERICTTIVDNYRLIEEYEWTVEANPETITEPVAEVLASTGPNRVSLGAQSFDQRVLDTLGRWHNPDNVAAAVRTLREAGVDRLSLDLIYGTPGETNDSWQRSLNTVVSMGVRHVSAYALTVESNTPYATRVRANTALAPDEDVQADRMQIAEDVLGRGGLERYEISNWAVPGFESAHNLVYWRGGQWLAFGCGAHGSWDVDGRRRRWWLLRDPSKYIRVIETGEDPVGGEEWPTDDQRRLEQLMMGLRIAEGVRRRDVEPLDPTVLDRLVASGLISVTDSDLALTTTGMAVAGAIIAELA